MGKHAHVVFDYIEVNTAAWVQERTGGPLDDLTRQHDTYVSDLKDRARAVAFAFSGVDTLHRFICTRAGEAWALNDAATLEPDTGQGIVSLSESVLIYRYPDPDHGPVAFVIEVDGAGIGSIRAYADTVKDTATWCTVEVQIGCPNGHGWSYRSGELIDTDGSVRNPGDIFPAGQIIIRDNDRRSATRGQYAIVCPQCSAPCDVELAQL